jgi:hypothetical protein
MVASPKVRPQNSKSHKYSIIFDCGKFFECERSVTVTKLLFLLWSLTTCHSYKYRQHMLDKLVSSYSPPVN